METTKGIQHGLGEPAVTGQFFHRRCVSGGLSLLLCLLFVQAVSGESLRPAQRFDYERAAHLARRSGFGATPEQIQTLADMGLVKAVNFVISGNGGEPMPTSAVTAAEAAKRMPVSYAEKPGIVLSYLKQLSDKERADMRRRLRTISAVDLSALRGWWLREMVTTSFPLREKMTLFWHGHFTSGAKEVKSTRLMAEQNHLFRQHALGRFDALLAGVARDPAMLRYLDGASNRKQHPNENFARELLELFTLGTGNYTEQDIAEAARAFTGWAVGPQGFRFRRGWHDRGTKTFLGQRGQLTGDDILRIVLHHPATAEHLAKKLLLYFVHDDPSPKLIQAMAKKLRSTNYDMAASLRALFLSEAFYADHVIGTQIKSPVDLVVGTLRMLDHTNVDYHALARMLGDMGQNLFQPPNVKGWDGGKTWLTPSTFLKREQFAAVLINGTSKGARRRRQARLEEHAAVRASVVADLPSRAKFHACPLPVIEIGEPLDFAGLMGDRPLRAGVMTDDLVRRVVAIPIGEDQRSDLVDLLGDENQRINPKSFARKGKHKDFLRAVFMLPEFQLQ
ncbi:MAG: DUF1800 domain-containing protein [Phycisphaerae bacterium]